MKVAFSIWNKRIAPVFDVSQRLLVLEIKEDKTITSNEEIFLDQDPIKKVVKLADMRIQELVCGAISRPLAEMVHSSGIKTMPFVAGDVDEVIKIYLEGGLPNADMSMPGCCARRQRAATGCEKKRLLNERHSPLYKRRRTMPRGDGTGPQGKGPGTGKGIGRCGSKGSQRQAGNRGQGRGAGAGQGRKRGPARDQNK